MWSEHKVRIIDIANELGVSTATVSNVIHGKTGKISSQTMKRVQEKLEERGYIPNMAAALLAQNNSRIIGVVIKNHEKYEGRLLADPFIASSLNDLSDEIEGNGWFMMVKKASDIMEAAKFAVHVEHGRHGPAQLLRRRVSAPAGRHPHPLCGL